MKDANKIKSRLVHELSELRLQKGEEISARLVAEEALRYVESIVETVREPLLVLNADLKIISTNRNFYKTFEVTPGETIGNFIFDLGNKQWDIPKLREILEEILQEKQEFHNFEVTHDFQVIGHKTMLLNARQIYRKEVGPKMILVAIEDITERKREKYLLMEAEELYRRVFETASDGILLFEKSLGKITHANPATKRMLGYTADEIIGNKLPDIGVVLDASDFQTTMKDLNEKGIIQYNDVPVRTKSEQYISTDICLVDRAKVVQCNIRDIADRKKAEAEIEESEERFRVIFERTTIGKSLTKPDGSLLQVNRAFADMLGYSIEKLQQFNFEHITHPDDVAESQEYIRSLVAGEQTDCRFEKRYLHKNGDTVWADVSTTLQRNAQGIPLYLITSIVDITERKRVEEALRESELLFRKVFEDHAAVKMILDPDTGDILDVNRAAVKFYGWSRVQLTQMKIQEINTLSPEEIKKEMEEARSNKKVHFEFRHRRADGSVRDVGAFSSKIKVNNKDLLHSIIFDISVRKQAEKDLVNTLELLRHAVNATIQVIVSTVEARDPYTANHQLRVAILARAIATEMKLPQNMIEGFYIVGSIHDLGKLSVPAEILSKPGKLTETEFSLIKEHAQKGYDILKNVESSWPLAEIVYQHHERMDGSGYPRNLKGDEILLEARILAVCDVVESMASHRPYRAALGIDAALKEIEDNRGVLYDADAVDACLRLFREKGFTLEKT